MAQEYAGQNVVFLEYDVDDPLFSFRENRWWTAYGTGRAWLPMVMVDSGNQISSDVVDASVYRTMIDTALARSSQAEITAYRWRDGDQVRFSVQVKNLTSVTLSYSNGATVWAIVYEDAHVANTDRYVRAAVSTSIPGLAPSATATYTLQTADLSGVNWDKLHYIALVEYRPLGTTGAYDMLQAAIVEPGFAVQPDEVTFWVDIMNPSWPLASVSLVGPEGVNWTAVVSTNWMTITPSSGSLAIQPVISVLSGTLSAGWQQGYITFTTTSGSFTDDVLVKAFYGSVGTIYLPFVTRD